MAATQELAVTELLKRHGASCWTSHFMRLDGMGQLPGLAAQRTMAAGYGFGPEGDVGVALAGLIAHYLSDGLEGAVSTLAEPYLYDGLGDSDGGCIVAAHMAEVSPSIADATGGKKPSLQVHKLDIGNSGIVARLVFPGKKGLASLASFVFRNGSPRLIVADVEAVASKAMKNLPVGHVTLKPLNGVKQFSIQWAAAAGSHHDALAYGLPSADWELFAKINGIPFVKIG
jgi:L-arabinose isomerase